MSDNIENADCMELLLAFVLFAFKAMYLAALTCAPPHQRSAPLSAGASRA